MKRYFYKICKNKFNFEIKSLNLNEYNFFSFLNFDFYKFILKTKALDKNI